MATGRIETENIVLKILQGDKAVLYNTSSENRRLQEQMENGNVYRSLGFVKTI